MDIRFVSSLTPDDEARLAAVLCAAATAMLDQLQIAYTIRIETTDGQTFHHSNAPALALISSPDVAPAL
jgi:hypothetical protein